MIMLDSDLMIEKGRPYSYTFNEDEVGKKYSKVYWYDLQSTLWKMESIKATDMIIDAGHGEGFCIGNIMKYAMRYGKKGSNNKDAEFKRILNY